MGVVGVREVDENGKVTAKYRDGRRKGQGLAPKPSKPSTPEVGAAPASSSSSSSSSLGSAEGAMAAKEGHCAAHPVTPKKEPRAPGGEAQEVMRKSPRTLARQSPAKKSKRSGGQAHRESRCAACNFELPTEGCAHGCCTACCTERGDGRCNYHREVDAVLLNWLEDTKPRQELRRALKKARTVDERHPENCFEYSGDSATLFCFADFLNTKAISAWTQPSNSKTSSRGWTEADKAVVVRRYSASRRERLQAFLASKGAAAE